MCMCSKIIFPSRLDLKCKRIALNSTNIHCQNGFCKWKENWSRGHVTAARGNSQEQWGGKLSIEYSKALWKDSKRNDSKGCLDVIGHQTTTALKDTKQSEWLWLQENHSTPTEAPSIWDIMASTVCGWSAWPHTELAVHPVLLHAPVSLPDVITWKVCERLHTCEAFHTRQTLNFHWSDHQTSLWGVTRYVRALILHLCFSRWVILSSESQRAIFSLSQVA